MTSSAASTVFTRDDIERLQPTSLTDLLSRVPRRASRTAAAVAAASRGFSFAGPQSAQSLVLVDGQRIANATSADSNLQFLSVDQIERVEVLRGSRSVIYGADAIGGVIQIFTRRGAEQGLKPRLKVGYGSNNSWQHSMGLSGGDQQTHFNLGVSLDETAGFNRSQRSFASDGDDDAYRNKSLNLNLSHQLGDDIEIGLNLLDNRGKTEFDNSFGRYDPATQSSVGQKPYSKFDLSSVSTYFDVRLTERWKSRLELGHSENRDTSLDTLSDDRSVFNTYRDSANWQNTLTLNDRHSLIPRRRLVRGPLPRLHHLQRKQPLEPRRVCPASLSRASSSPRSLGLRRHDQNQQFGGQNTWSGTLTVPINPDNDVLLSYSEGFRAPTFNDLYYPDTQYSNPNLRPETSKSYELQWRSQLSDHARLEASLYRTNLSDAIILDSTSKPQNVASARINGFEAALKQELFGWQGNVGVSFIDPRDRDTGHTLARRARRTLSLDLDRQFDALGVGASWQAISNSYNAQDNQDRLGGYALLGLRSRWAVTREVSVSLNVDNLLDRQYARARYSYNAADFSNNQNYREEGRTWMLSLTWTPEL
ncbi:TonB-dependent receptor [Pseudomonas sp. RTB3]|nr:TonB-dependent receptor [Pseudomonas sp. RTB3]